MHLPKNGPEILEFNPNPLNQLPTSTYFPKTMLFATLARGLGYRTESRLSPVKICVMDGAERRHLGPTLQELRKLNSESKLKVSERFPVQFLTSFSDGNATPSAGVWKNSVEKRGKHLGPTFEEIVNMKRDSHIKAEHCITNKPHLDSGMGPTQVKI